MTEIGMWLLRKVLITAWLLVAFWFVDRVYLKDVDTVKELNGNGQALAILLGLLAYAIASA